MDTVTTQDTPKSEDLLSPHVPARVPHVNAAQYADMYAKSVANPEAFWAEQGKRLD